MLLGQPASLSELQLPHFLLVKQVPARCLTLEWQFLKFKGDTGTELLLDELLGLLGQADGLSTALLEGLVGLLWPIQGKLPPTPEAAQGSPKSTVTSCLSPSQGSMMDPGGIRVS